MNYSSDEKAKNPKTSISKAWYHFCDLKNKMKTIFILIFCIKNKK